jgi:hypothetical protein
VNLVIKDTKDDDDDDDANDDNDDVGDDDGNNEDDDGDSDDDDDNNSDIYDEDDCDWDGDGLLFIILFFAYCMNRCRIDMISNSRITEAELNYYNHCLEGKK